MKTTAALVTCLCVASVGYAQNPPALEDLLKRVEQLGIDAKALQNPPAPQGPLVVLVQPGGLQAAIDKTTGPTILALVPGTVYKESVIVSKAHPGLTITSKDCEFQDRVVQPADSPQMATVQGGPGQSYGLWVMASGTTVRCLSFGPNASGQGEMLRVGDSQSTVLENTPDNVTVRQNYFHGDPVIGQKRAIAANGSHLLIDQNFAEDIWLLGQDSQCVAVFSTPGPVTISRNVFGCGSENIIIGGVPPAGPAFLPSDVLTERNVLFKPLAWKGTSHQVKNLYEVKIGKRIMARKNLLVNNWVDAQQGIAVLATIATNGTCGAWCVMEDVGFEDNIVWRVAGGLSLTGYQYQLPQSGAGVRFSIKNNLWWITKTMGGTSRVIQIENEPKDVDIDSNTFMHEGSTIIMASYGSKWLVGDPAKIPAGPVQGLRYVNNVAQHGTATASYGIFTPEGNAGANLGTYFPGAIIASNVFGGASSTAIGKYNAFTAGLTPTNVSQSLVDFNVQITPAVSCPSSTFRTAPVPAGADCSRLPLDLWDLVPVGAK